MNFRLNHSNMPIYNERYPMVFIDIGNTGKIIQCAGDDIAALLANPFSTGGLIRDGTVTTLAVEYLQRSNQVRRNYLDDGFPARRSALKWSR